MSFLSTATGVAVIDARIRSGTITLPLTSQIPNRYFQIKDLYGAFSRSSLTVSTQAGESFDDGTTTKLYTDPFTFLTLYAASTSKWAQLGGTQTISQTISSLNVSSITIGSGLGWLQLPPVQTVAVSTNTINADTIITNSTTSMYISAQILYVSSIMGAVVGAGNLTTSNLTSTVGGLGQIYISTAGGGLSVANLTSTVGGLGQIYISTAGGGITTANLVSTTANLQSAPTQFVSSLTINTLTIGSGAGWLQLPPIQTIYASTTIVQGQALYSLSSYFGNTSSATALQFNGLQCNYTNTVLAEVSTGPGTQEFLVFKGSSTSDRVRVQTTGNFVVETGVSARLWPTVTSNATPAFIINTSSNVGIQTASPGATLDVAGTGRFQTLSSLALNISSINGTVYSAGGGGITTANLQSTVGGLGQIYLSTATGGIATLPSTISSFSLLTSSLLASTVTTSNSFAISTLTSSLRVNGTGLISWNGTNSASFYGAGVDTFTLQTNCNAYVGGIASLAFAANAASYPLGRIYAVDSATTGSAISQLVFQTVAASPNNFNTSFTYSGSIQTFTVPTGVTILQVTMWGAGGSGGNNGPGGAGAFIRGTLSVTPGQSLRILVGQGGVFNSTSSSFGGGGGTTTTDGYTGAGGGRSAIQITSTASITSASGSGSAITYTTDTTHGLQTGQPVILSGLSPSGFNGTFAVASVPASNQFTVTSTQSGSSSGTGTIIAEVLNIGGGGAGPQNAVGVNGGAATFSGTAFSAPSGYGGGGGSQTSGGAAGIGGSVPAGTAGSILQGGTGSLAGGGGGGGYYGGGGGAWTSAVGNGGGGGGSSYTSFTGFSIIVGSNSPNSANQAPATGDSAYISGVAVGGTTNTTGGNGLIILTSIGGSITEAMRIGSNGYLGVGTTSPTYTLDVAGNARLSNAYLGTNSTLITQQFYGLFGNYNNTVLAEISTGGGTQELLVFKGSSASDRVRVQTTGNFIIETGVSARLWSTNTAITSSNLTPAFIVNTSSNVGIQTASPQATLDVAGTGRFQNLSSLALSISSINGTVYSAGGGITTANLTSTVGGLGQIYLSTATGGVTSIPQNLSTAAFFTSSILASTITTSSLQVNSLIIGTGTGWVNLGPIQAVAVSSLQENTGSMYAATAYIGNLSTASALQFNGLFGNYTNTVLAEVSTGAGTQELLIFKGSSVSDRVRVQTTGDVRFETGVSTRLWSNTTVPTLSNVTPAMIINASSNVGIQTASPAATLDVAGTGRFQVLSTLQLNVSSILGVTLGGGGITTANLQSTVGGLGQIYISTATGGGSSGPVPFISALTVSTTSLFASTVSSYVINTYAVVGSALFNDGPDDLAVTSLTNMNISAYSNIIINPFLNLTLNNSQSTFIDTNTLYVNSSNEVRMVTPQLITSNLFVNQGVSTYSMTIYGPSTLTVQGWSYFQNTVSAPTMMTNRLGIFDSTTNIPSYMTMSSGTLKIGQTPLTGIYPSNYVVAGRLDANQSLTPDTDNTIQFVTDFDPQGWYNPGTYLFTPTIAGYYTVSYQVWFDRVSFGDNQFNIQIQKNGADTYALSQNQTLNSNVGLTLNATKIIYMNGSTDYLKFNAYVGNSGNTCSAQYGNLQGSGTFFTASLVTGGGGGGGGSSGVSQIIAGSNVTISPIEGVGVVTINATGGGGGPSGPIPYLSSYSISTGYVYSPLQLGTNATESHMAFYGVDGTYTQSVIAEEDTGGGNQELLMFRGPNASDRIRFQTTGSMVFESGVSSRVWPSVPSNATPAMVIDTSSNVGIQTAAPGATLDVAGTGRFLAVSTTAIYTGSLFASLYFI